MDRLKISLAEWIDGLDRYSEDEILIQPEAGKWSIGQVYMHLLAETSYFISQVKYCIEHEENILKEMKEEGRQMFLQNEFPDIQIDRGPSLSIVEQPRHKQMLRTGFEKLRQEIESIDVEKASGGKTMHPGLGYFNAMEWLQFSEMHLRHHVRQRRRIDEFLRNRR